MPRCKLDKALDAILKRILGLRTTLGVSVPILIQKIDVKNAFRQVGVNPDGTGRFWYSTKNGILSTAACSSGR